MAGELGSPTQTGHLSSGVSELSIPIYKNIPVAFLFEVPDKRIVSSHKEGRIAIVRKRGMRCGGRGSVRHAVGHRARGRNAHS